MSTVGRDHRTGPLLELGRQYVPKLREGRDAIGLGDVEKELLILPRVRETHNEALGHVDGVEEEAGEEAELEAIVEPAQAAPDHRLALAEGIPGEADAGAVVVAVVGDVLFIPTQPQVEGQVLADARPARRRVSLSGISAVRHPRTGSENEPG